MEISANDIDFFQPTCSVSWAKPKIHSVVKVAPVRAEPAKVGDLIESKNDNFLITISVAEAGDYKVWFNDGDVGFVSAEKFLSTHLPDPKREGWYRPKKYIRRAVELTKDIRLKAPWGTLQYAQSGDYLVYINEKDIYCVPKKLFRETYEVIS